MKPASLRLFVVCSVVSLVAISHAADPIPWQVINNLNEGLDVSGAAILPDGKGWLVSDETRSVQAIILDRVKRTLTAGDSLSLLPGKGKEMDLEGITSSSDTRWFYATGSHSVSRKKAEVQPDRQHIFRFTPIGVGDIAVATLSPVITSEDCLRDSAGKGSDQGGLDLEGIAERAGMLYFGLRSPSKDGHAYIIEVKADDLFADAAKAAHRTHEITLGVGFGIRDIVRVRDGFLIISGPSGTDESAQGFTLYHWSGPGGKATKLTDIHAKDGKAEGVVLLEETSEEYTLLILFDGVENGAPTEFKVEKPSP